MINSKTYTYCLFILCFSICTIIPAFAGTWRDDFEDNNTKEWEIFNLDRQVEKWWINDGEAVGEIFFPGFMSLWLTGDLDWRFYSLSCRIMLEDDRNDPPYIGLTLQDRGHEDSRYLFMLYSVTDTVSIIKGVAGGGRVNQPFIIEKGVWYDITASVSEDGTLRFKINDFEFTAVDPSPLRSGQAGLVVGDARARFDDVEISGANIPNGGPGKPRDVEPQTKLATTWGKLKSR